MEYAGGSFDITVNCTELMKAGEVGDEEATAASVALIAMHEIWGHHSFTAKDVVEAMTPEDADDQAKAESIANALEGLDGKRFGSPDSAQRRKALPKTPGRSTFMDRGRTNGCHIETVGGHNRQYLQIQLSGSGQEFTAGSSSDHCFSDPGQTHSQYSPHSPGQGREDAGVGKEGKEGKDFRADGAASPNAKKAAPRWSSRL